MGFRKIVRLLLTSRNDHLQSNLKVKADTRFFEPDVMTCSQGEDHVEEGHRS